MTPELRSALAANRAELLALLSGEPEPEPEPEPGPDKGPNLGPLSPPAPSPRGRPSSPPPSFGYTMGAHVVELPRTPGEERKDPLKLVTGLGWPEWTPATAEDRQGIELQGENAA